MEPKHEEQHSRQPPPGIIIPPGYEYMTVGETPEEFTHGVLMKAFADYSVALGRWDNGTPSWLGSGVLVRKGERFGILTAHHCLHAHSPQVRVGSADDDTLCMLLNRGRSVIVKPQEVREHVLAVPRCDEFGPDLTFIEILSIERLGTFKAIGTFWALDRQASEITDAFGKPLTPMVSIGYPSVYFNTLKEANVTRHQIKHMVYDNAIKEGDVFEKDGWDYLDTTISDVDNPGLPLSFAGLSGGPVWGMELGRNKINRKIEIRKHALIGITFYEIFKKKGEGRLRAHFIKSIYELAWKNFP